MGSVYEQPRADSRHGGQKAAASPGNLRMNVAPAGPELADTYPSKAAREALFYKGMEQVQEVEATVTGNIPSWLCGSLNMVGGGDYSHMRHLFDGYGLISKFRVEEGKAWGSQRYVDSKAYRAYKSQGQVVYVEFATPPESLSAYLQTMLAPIGRIFSSKFTPMTDNASVSLYAVGPAGVKASPEQRRCNTAQEQGLSSNAGNEQVQIMAITEDQFGNYLVDPDTLETLQQVQYKDEVPAIMQSPHPAVLSDGSLLNFSRTFPFGGAHLFKQDRVTLQRKEVAYIPDRHWLTPAWMHDFAATDKHAVLIEQPLYMDFLAMLAGWEHDALWMRWRPTEGCRVHLITLDGSKPVKTFWTPAFSYIHIGNAFESEDGRTLHVDLGVFKDAQILNDLKLQPLRQGPERPEGGKEISPCTYQRLDIPLTGTGPFLQSPKPLVSDAAAKHVDFVDFPCVHPGYKGRYYRYVYVTCAVRPTNIANALAKIDVETGEVKVWHKPGGVTGEPHFVAKPDAVAEDAGVVLSQCVDETGSGFLLVLDASTWTELACAQLPYGIPYRFHGVWLAKHTARHAA